MHWFNLNVADKMKIGQVLSPFTPLTPIFDCNRYRVWNYCAEDQQKTNPKPEHSWFAFCPREQFQIEKDREKLLPYSRRIIRNNSDTPKFCRWIFVESLHMQTPSDDEFGHAPTVYYSSDLIRAEPKSRFITKFHFEDLVNTGKGVLRKAKATEFYEIMPLTFKFALIQAETAEELNKFMALKEIQNCPSKYVTGITMTFHSEFSGSDTDAIAFFTMNTTNDPLEINRCCLQHFPEHDNGLVYYPHFGNWGK